MRPESEIPLLLPEAEFGPPLDLPFGSLSQSLFLSDTQRSMSGVMVLPSCTPGEGNVYPLR